MLYADTISTGLVVAGVVVLVTAASLGARWRVAIPISLELWTGAGVLRLVGDPSWARIATAAAIVAIRRVIVSRPP